MGKINVNKTAFVYNHSSEANLNSFWLIQIKLCIRASTVEQADYNCLRVNHGPIFSISVNWDTPDTRGCDKADYLSQKQAERADSCSICYWLTWKSMQWLSSCACVCFSIIVTHSDLCSSSHCPHRKAPCCPLIQTRLLLAVRRHHYTTMLPCFFIFTC